MKGYEFAGESKGIVISLCDLTGTMVRPWIDAGYEAILVDPQHPAGVHRDGRITRVGHIIDHPVTWSVLRAAIATGRVVFVSGFPPCTDLAVSGARWFETKREADPAFQFKAMHVVWQCQVIGELAGAPWFAENPVSQIKTYWRDRDHAFQPFEFTALAENDNYTKQTCLWVGGGFEMPPVAIHPQVAEAIARVKSACGRFVPKKTAIEALPGDELVERWYPDNRIHQAPPGEERANFRSATPEGFAIAVFRANAPHLRAQLAA